MRLPLPFAALGAAAALVAGCTTPVSPSDAADAEVSTTATAIVVVEGSIAGDGQHADAVARFVKARGGAVDDAALRMAGAVVDFPAIGACGALATSRATQARAIALLDVGAVTLTAGDVATPLAPRQLPDVADLVSGVVYSARGDALPSRSAYTLRVDGSPDLDVAPFLVTATSPGEPADVRVARAAGGAMDLAWEPGTGTDAIYVDVLGPAGATIARCSFADLGRASIPAVAFGALDEGSLSVHRLHREPFTARGVDPGEVRFDFARVVPFARR